MLDTDTRRRIDTARDILVGKVPDPKSQVEQITIALIYKFMDDIDAESEELGGERTFFANEFARYGWAKLMHLGIGGHETLNLYSEAITRMPENPGIPPLFRSIFDNAYLPYRDPETLRAFLTIINEFTYDHSERLGDAFEYLLSVLGSQGDAGQFRTPRHIIDFMVSIIDPKKDERILDPACGTAGFLISSYKHILAANTDADGNSTLTPDDMRRLANGFTGYDISPDMVRLSLVNMYLHGFVDPSIFEYDTLTSEDRWDDYADIILANPPFMSPKGGIRPHNRFSIKAGRSEVLFVDYMAEHLTPSGRSGIIVPEGVIFQSQNAHRQLRKMLVEESLVAVVSLPGSVFNPYSGVKTSILVLDKALARNADCIAFFKVENDGYGLGAQRRQITEDDLPQVQAELSEYMRRLSSQEPFDDFTPRMGLVVDKAKIATDGEYNLSGERYRQTARTSSAFPFHPISSICTINPRKSEVSDLTPNMAVSFVPMADLNENSIGFTAKQEKNLGDVGASYTYFADEDVLLAKVTPCFENGKAGIARNLTNGIGFGSSEFYVLRSSNNVLPEWVYFCVTHPFFRQAGIRSMTGTGGLQRVPRRFVEDFTVPLPPMRVQKEIVTEIEGYQRVIDGARAVVENYRPQITVDPEWPIMKLGEVCEINPDKVNPEKEYPDQNISYIDISSVENQTGRFLGYTEMSSLNAPSRARRGVRIDDVLLSTVRPNLRAFTLVEEIRERTIVSTGFAVLRAIPGVAEPGFIFVSICSDNAVSQMIRMMGKGAYPSINQSDVASINITLPTVETQQAIVAEIEAERVLVDTTRELITRFERKIQGRISRIWGE